MSIKMENPARHLARSSRAKTLLELMVASWMVLLFPIASSPSVSAQTTPDRSPRVALLRVAEEFVKSVNAGSSQAALQLTHLPLLYRNQEWKNATTGGYTIGAAHDSVLSDKSAAARFMRKLVKDVRVKHTKALNGPSKSEILATYLAGAPAGWRELELFFFVRGTGDVEHVVLVGVDSASEQVRGIYTN
jgi:hypothetical protein